MNKDYLDGLFRLDRAAWLENRINWHFTTLQMRRLMLSTMQDKLQEDVMDGFIIQLRWFVSSEVIHVSFDRVSNLLQYTEHGHVYLINAQDGSARRETRALPPRGMLDLADQS